MNRTSRYLFLLLVVGLATGPLANGQTPVVPPGSVVNGATFLGSEPIAPGSLISIFGTQLSASPASADSVPLSVSLNGTSVTFTGPAGTFDSRLLFVEQGQINAQVPWELIPSGTTSASVTVVVRRDGASSTPAPVMAGSLSPGIFALNGRGFAANYPDNTLAWPVGAVAGLTTHPAKAGGVLVIYCTGLGPLDSAVADGANSLDKLRNTLTKPVVQIGGVSAQVLFSGLTPQFVGTYQVNVTVPDGVTPGDNVPLQILMGGITTSATSSTIAISQ